MSSTMMMRTGQRQPVSATARRKVLVRESLLFMAAMTSVPTTTTSRRNQPTRATTASECARRTGPRRHIPS
jgi:hypothetical protein